MPYFYRKSIEQPFYDLSVALAMRPAPPALIITATTPSQLRRRRLRRHRTRARRAHLRRRQHVHPAFVQIVPPISIASAPSATVLPLGIPTLSITTALEHSLIHYRQGQRRHPPRWTLDPPPAPTMVHGDQSTTEFVAHPPASFSSEQLFHISAKTPDNHEYTESYRGIGYAGLPATNAYAPAHRSLSTSSFRQSTASATCPAPATPYRGSRLHRPYAADADCRRPHYGQAQAVRYRHPWRSHLCPAHPDLHGAPTQALLDYARNGGNVVVQYQTAEFTSDDALTRFLRGQPG